MCVPGNEIRPFIAHVCAQGYTYYPGADNSQGSTAVPH